MSETTTDPRTESEATPLRRPEEATVLVVDDEPDVVIFLSSVLEDAGINVLTAHDGVDAEVRGGGEMTACDNCTRILYSEV